MGCAVICSLFSVAVFAAAEPELIPFWEPSSEQSGASVDHSAWQTLLNAYIKTHPSGVNRFDYAGLKAATHSLANLNSYLAALQSVDPRELARAEQKAYWINFYNALTVKVVVDAYPVESIKEIHESWIPRAGPWGDVHAKVAGQDLTLDNIEHGILRPIWQDARIHYGVNCASIGCPNLTNTAFTASNTEALLDAAARDYINHVRGVDVLDEDFMVISSIYTWFVVDFGDSEEGVIAHLMKYAKPELAAQLENFNGTIDYEYDWALNQP
ncbi:MAG: DUF547 domain-containing protein [Gammaproteobacteria bacterium]|nr:DUF547 domain-containing protein [Gammaproteobacteria bacterium]